MNGVQAHFKNIESLHNLTAGNSCYFPLKAASALFLIFLLQQFLKQPIITLNMI